MIKKPSAADNLGLVAFAIAAICALVAGNGMSILVGVAFVLLMVGVLPKQLPLAFLVGASVIVLLQSSVSMEGFANGLDPDLSASGSDSSSGSYSGSYSGADDSESCDPETSTESFQGSKKSKPMLPDNATRKEPLELGKAYKLPSEKDDEGYHLDAGTTFLNAYKALKPEQVAAMTRDTQDLLATQKSLMGMLDSFGPLMKDMTKITGFMNAK
jgi:hypothetical protein